MHDSEPPAPSAWAPFSSRPFRELWLAAFVSNVGTWMQNVAAAWLMTTLSTSPALVALVQTATSLPVFVFALPGGALADTVDRRRLLLLTQTLMLVAAGALGLLVWLGGVTPLWLLAFTGLLGVGSALNGPAYLSTVPDLVSREQVPAAVALNSANFNMARATGPALGGIVVAAFGPAAAFGLNALSFAAVIGAIARWRPAGPPVADHLPQEPLVGAIRAGLRYARFSRSLLTVLLRVLVFILCGSALWSLLPLVAKIQLGLSASGYGTLLGCLGVGAVIGALVGPQLRDRLGYQRVVILACLLFAAASGAAAWSPWVVVTGAFLIVGGAGWVLATASFNTVVQISVPRWVRARALALYLLVFQGGFALGAVLWGVVAEVAGTRSALTAAGAGLVAGLLVTTRYQLGAPDRAAVEPAPLSQIDADLNVEPSAGPIVVQVEYRVDPARAQDFERALARLARARRRTGATEWSVLQDVSEPARWLEMFRVDSWADHLRQRARATEADVQIRAGVRAFHVAADPPVVRHWLASPQVARTPPTGTMPGV